MTGFLQVVYEDGNQSTYKGLEISTGSTPLKFFNYGNITIDYIDFILWWSHEQEEIISVVSGSSMDHFFMDGEEYKRLIIDHNNNNAIVTDTSKMPFNELNKLITYPVHRNIETFEELKIYYRSVRPKQD